MDVVIGKNTLESLTAGMYSDAKVIFREYIQNSVDSIDEAIKKDILDKDNSFINIIINEKKCQITIEDNGLGVSKNNSINTLLDIGNSSKDYENNRGFRGIGRLAGLSYCDSLTFVTSYKGENCKTEVTFNGVRLKDLLLPHKYKNYDLIHVIDEITDYKTEKDDIDEHYFKVILKGVKNIDNILDYTDVKDYLVQVAPLPYNSNEFFWSKEIKDKFNLIGKPIKEYNIFLTNSNNREKLYKLYSQKFVANLKQKISDQIKEIRTELITDKNENILGIMWYSISNFYGTIIDNRLKGIRFKKGNIQVGDRMTLNHIFKEDRFNGWFQGEVLVLDARIIPNARRDDFEKNQVYLKMLDELKKIGNDLSNKIRNASRSRNTMKGKILNNAQEVAFFVQNKLEKGFNSKKEKKELLNQLNENQKEIASIKSDSQFNKNKKNNLFKKLEILTNKVEESNKYKIIELNDKLTTCEKNTLEKVFNVITDNFDNKQTEKIVKMIVDNF